jgi:hypothetical protein
VRILEEEKVIRNAWLKDPKRYSKYYKIVFPENEDTGLDNSVFSPNADNAKLSVKVVMLETTGVLMTQQYRISLLCDICLTKEEPPKVKSSGPVKNKLSAKYFGWHADLITVGLCLDFCIKW